MTRRVLIAKPGLDGHDRGAKIVARALRDAGFEVVFTGIRQRVEAIVATAVQEDVDVVGLSILSGAHLALTSRTIQAIVATAVQEDVDVVGLSILSGAHLALTSRTIQTLRAAGAGDIAVVVGGTIPQVDIPRLRSAGAAAVFPTGTPLDDVVRGIRSLTTVPSP
jgi:methylmalonyl-CoA mutase C-terminal domain/subunit